MQDEIKILREDNAKLRAELSDLLKKYREITSAQSYMMAQMSTEIQTLQDAIKLATEDSDENL